MKKKPRFKKGELVIEDFYNREGVIIQVVERGEDYKYPFKCLVEFTRKKLFSGKEVKTREWLNEAKLNKYL
jgi:hypothetical protein